jgi:hypothetical protein
LSDENAQLEVQFEHVTAALGGELLKVDSGSLPRKLLPMQVSAADCIFSNVGNGPLVAMTGNSPPQDFRALFSWTGRNNIYDHYSTFWSMQSTEGAARAAAWDFATWRSNWTEASEANPRRAEGGIWGRRQTTGKPFSEVGPDDFALDRTAPANPAIGSATDSSDAGASLPRISRATRGPYDGGPNR